MDSINNNNYFCYKCNRSVHISEDGKCVTCNDGFIERIESDNSIESDDDGKCVACNDGFVERIESDNSIEIDDDALSIFDISRHIPVGGSLTENYGGSLLINSLDPEYQNSFLGQLMSNLFRDLLSFDNELGTSAFNFSNEDLDNIMTTLMFEQCGAPPAKKEDIENLPKSRVTDLMDNCSICLSDYEVEDEVSELPCHHKYHFACVKSWLIKHGSCPICRKDLSDKSRTIEIHDPTADNSSIDL